MNYGKLKVPKWKEAINEEGSGLLEALPPTSAPALTEGTLGLTRVLVDNSECCSFYFCLQTQASLVLLGPCLSWTNTFVNPGTDATRRARVGRLCHLQIAFLCCVTPKGQSDLGVFKTGGVSSQVSVCVHRGVCCEGGTVIRDYSFLLKVQTELSLSDFHGKVYDTKENFKVRVEWVYRMTASEEGS